MPLTAYDPNSEFGDKNFRSSRSDAIVGFLQNIDGILPDGANILTILPALLQLQHDKEAVYGQSWRKYGHTSAFFDLARKWNRIDNIMQKALVGGVDKTLFSKDISKSETFLDTIIDIAVYGLLWASYIADTQPELWEKFLKTNNL